jgi:hypothetical protein
MYMAYSAGKRSLILAYWETHYKKMKKHSVRVDQP